MMNKDFRIVFMGTPDFAVGILGGLIANKFNVVASITAPDKPAGRGQKISESAVKTFCVENDIPVLQPTNLKDETFVQSLSELNADLFVVVAFRMLPEVIWNMPPKGTINLHASLLPQYRGAAPINWAIVNGESETGVTTFFIEKEIDTGMVIERASISIGENETAGELHDRLMNLGRELVVKSVAQIEDGSVVRTSQDSLIESNLRSAPKIFKPMCEIDWNQNVQTIHDFCRGFSPYPTAWTTIINEGRNESKSVKIFRTEKTEIPVENAKLLKKDAEGLLFPCNDFYLRITEIQPEGKRRMTHKEFAAGYNFNDWKI
jgi:methionyl-tRNA formyltransferase